MMRIILLPMLFVLIALSFGCGVKAPPLPPIPDTPMSSDITVHPEASPSPKK